MPLPHLRFARTPWSRAIGLLGRSSFPKATALVIERCASVHTWFMRMPIDVVFVDDGWRIIAIHRCVAPGRVVRESGAYAVLELAADEAQQLELQIGTVVYERNARQI